MKKLNHFPKGSAEYVVLHAEQMVKRGRNPSRTFLFEKNPRRALVLAKRLAYFPTSLEGYLAGVQLKDYHCADCGASDCKLWRPYQSMDVNLLCAKCAGKNQKMDVESLDDDGKVMSEISGKTDQIGWYIPAVPTEDLSSY